MAANVTIFVYFIHSAALKILQIGDPLGDSITWWLLLKGEKILTWLFLCQEVLCFCTCHNIWWDIVDKLSWTEKNWSNVNSFCNADTDWTAFMSTEVYVTIKHASFHFKNKVVTSHGIISLSSSNFCDVIHTKSQTPYDMWMTPQLQTDT